MKISLVFLFVFATGALNAQQKEGRIVYNRTIHMQLRNFRNDPELEKQIPKSRTDQYELLFSGSQALWQFLPNANADGGEQSFGNGGVMIRFAGGMNDASFFDLNTGTRVDHRDVMDHSFIVSDSIRKISWKLSDETKTILEHVCRKATATRISTRVQMTMENGEMKRNPVEDTSVVVAWYTADIPVAVGPEYVGQLPGAVLELDIANGQTSYIATEITPKVNTKTIKAPKDGKKLTQAEFVVERDRIMEEMRKNMPSNGNVQFRTMQ